MKHIVFLLTFLFTLSLWSQSQIVETTPSLTRATVYLQSAQLEYKTQTKLPQGNVELIFKGLSPYLIKESVELNGLGEAEIINMKFRNNFMVNERDNIQIKKLEKELLIIKKQIDQLESEINALNDELILLKANGKTEKANLTYIKQYIEYYKKRYLTVRKLIFQKEQTLNPLYEKRKKIEKQLNELKGKSRRQAKDLIVHLYVKKPGIFSFKLTYITQSAYWQPAYTIRAKNNKEKLHWTYQAEIHQNTGLDWNNVPVTLSSYRPSFHTTIPQIFPWYLSPKQNVYSINQRGAKAKVAEAAAMDTEVAYSQPQITESTLDVQYTMEKNYSVPSGQEPVIITLQSFETPGELNYFAVPVRSQNAYLMAKIKTEELTRYRLLPGNAKLYYEGRYTGQTFIDPQSAEEKIKLSLGTDPEIVIRRKMTRNYKDYKSLSGKVIVKRTYVISVKNNKKIPVEITIKDHVPVSQDEKIEVRNVQISNGGKKNKKGIITWKIKLNPGEKTDLSFSFEVKFPKNYRTQL